MFFDCLKAASNALCGAIEITKKGLLDERIRQNPHGEPRKGDKAD